MSVILAVLGPLLMTVGALLLAYQVLRGPVEWYRKEFFGRGHLKALHELHGFLMSNIDVLPSPPYTPEAIEKLRKEELTKHRDRIEKEDEQQRTQDLDVAFKVQKIALWGFALVGLGGICQAVGAILCCQP